MIADEPVATPVRCDDLAHQQPVQCRDRFAGQALVGIAPQQVGFTMGADQQAAVSAFEDCTHRLLARPSHQLFDPYLARANTPQPAADRAQQQFAVGQTQDALHAPGFRRQALAPILHGAVGMPVPQPATGVGEPEPAISVGCNAPAWCAARRLRIVQGADPRGTKLNQAVSGRAQPQVALGILRGPVGQARRQVRNALGRAALCHAPQRAIAFHCEDAAVAHPVERECWSDSEPVPCVGGRVVVVEVLG